MHGFDFSQPVFYQWQSFRSYLLFSHGISTGILLLSAKFQPDNLVLAFFWNFYISDQNSSKILYRFSKNFELHSGQKSSSISRQTFFYFRSEFSMRFPRIKVHTYSENATIFCGISNVDLSYVSSYSQIYGEDFAKFCDLLRIYVWTLIKNF